MRFTRLTAILVAAIASLAMVFTVAPADAAPAAAERAGTFGKFNTKAVDSNTLKAYGNTDGWGHKVVLIQRRLKSGGRWITEARTRTTGTGAFGVKLNAGSDIPCHGRWILRAKKRGTSIFKVDDQVWYC